MPTRAQQKRLREVERHYEALFGHLTRFDLQAPPPEADDDQDLLGELVGGASSQLVLGFYSLEGIRRGLSHYGFTDAVARRGYPDAHITVDVSDPWKHVLQIWASPTCARSELLMDLRLRLADRAEGTAVSAPHPRGLEGWLVVEWLVLQSPTAHFDPVRGVVPLPGQRSPGLGIGAETLALLERIATRLGKRGILSHPSWMHNAVMYRPRFRFTDPGVQGRFDALRRDTAGFTMGEVSWAVELGCVDDAEAGQPWMWRGEEMALPLTEPDRAALDTDAWRAEREQAREASHFRLDVARLRTRLEETRAEGGDEPVPTAADLRRFGVTPNVRCVLVPHDLSETACAALPVAATLAAAFHAAVHLGHVARPALPGRGGTEPAVPAALEAAAELLRPFVRDVQCFARRGVPATELLRAADLCGYDLIVMARGSVNPLLGLIGGTTTDRLVREARSPVIVVPRALPDLSWRPRRILFPVDFSAATVATTPLVVALAEVLSAELEVVHAVDLPPGVPIPPVERGEDGVLGIDEVRRVFDNPIDRFLDRLERLAPEARFTLVRGADPARAILERAAETDTSLVVMAAQGNGLIHRLLIGSTTARVIEGATVPVMVVPPDVWAG